MALRGTSVGALMPHGKGNQVIEWLVGVRVAAGLFVRFANSVNSDLGRGFEGFSSEKINQKPKTSFCRRDLVFQVSAFLETKSRQFSRKTCPERGRRLRAGVMVSCSKWSSEPGEPCRPGRQGGVPPGRRSDGGVGFPKDPALHPAPGKGRGPVSDQSPTFFRQSRGDSGGEHPKRASPARFPRFRQQP
jgi:hypothetical protein